MKSVIIGEICGDKKGRANSSRPIGCCAHKAGLAPNAWQDPETEVYLFTADVLGAEFKNI